MITLKSSFEEILGKDAKQFTEEQRRERWGQWKALATKTKRGLSTIEYWSDITACVGCVHLEKENAWCKSVGLPCTVNPVLSFSMGCIGMACCGVGYEAEEIQLELFK